MGAMSFFGFPIGTLFSLPFATFAALADDEPEEIPVDAPWQAQTWVDSQAIQDVQPDGDEMVLESQFIGGHANFSKGEVWLD